MHTSVLRFKIKIKIFFKENVSIENQVKYLGKLAFSYNKRLCLCSFNTIWFNAYILQGAHDIVFIYIDRIVVT